MFAKQLVTAVGTIAGFAGLIVAGTLLISPRVRADDEHRSRPRVDADDERGSSDEWQIELGLQIAPVQLTYAKHNRKLVGLGSYLVNAVSECNGCHSAGPATQYAKGHNPFQRLGPFTPPKTVNTATYKAIPCIAGTPRPDGSRDLTTHLCF